MRHFFSPPPVPALPSRVPPRTFATSLVPPSRLALTRPPLPPCAVWAAIPPPRQVAQCAEREHAPASRVSANGDVQCDHGPRRRGARLPRGPMRPTTGRCATSRSSGAIEDSEVLAPSPRYVRRPHHSRSLREPGKRGLVGRRPLVCGVEALGWAARTDCGSPGGWGAAPVRRASRREPLAQTHVRLTPFTRSRALQQNACAPRPFTASGVGASNPTVLRSCAQDQLALGLQRRAGQHPAAPRPIRKPANTSNASSPSPLRPSRYTRLPRFHEEPATAGWCAAW